MKNLASIIIALVVAPAVVSAHVMNAQKFFDVETKRRCPSHHLEWLGDGSYDEVLQAYEASLPKNLRHKIDKISDYSHKCSDVRSGFYCLWEVTTDAYQNLDILRKFTAWTCRHVRCQEAADCKI